MVCVPSPIGFFFALSTPNSQLLEIGHIPKSLIYWETDGNLYDYITHVITWGNICSLCAMICNLWMVYGIVFTHIIYGGFHKRGVPLFIILFNRISPFFRHPFSGTPMTMDSLKWDYIQPY